MKPVHAGRLERYLGPAKCAELSLLMKDWHGPPIALKDVPGVVFATPGGDFVGDFREGWELNFIDRAEMLARRVKRAARVASSRNRNQLNAGFTSLSDLIAEATAGKKQEVAFHKAGNSGATGFGNSLWPSGGHPGAGAVGSASPGGRACDNTTTGALQGLPNAGSGDTTHLVSSFSTCGGLNGASLLLYDRLFDVAKTMSSNAVESVTGTPSRYQSTTPGDPDYAGGNFVFPEVIANLSATSHLWAAGYTDQDGNTGASISAIGGITSAGVGRIDLPIYYWFMPLAAGDSGVKELTSMQCSSASLTGTLDFVMGHPLAWITHPLSNQIAAMDHISTAFNLVRVFDDACLALLEPTRSSSAAATYTGQLVFVSG